MVHVGDKETKELFVGDMGIKEVAIGDEIIFNRPGGYFYLELITKEENING